MKLEKLVVAAALALAASGAWSEETDLEKDFDRAFAAGEPLKADQAFRKLVDKKPNTAAIRYYNGAEVSRQLGKTTDRRTRLAHYLRVEQGWNETTEQAAWEMCLSANDADEFTLLTTKVPASRTLFNAGIQLLDAFRSQKRAADFKKVATAMFQVFRESSDREAIYGRIGGLMVDGVPGFSYNDARGFFDRYPVKDMGCLDWTMRARADAFSPLWRLDYMAKNQVLMTPEPYQYTWNINYGKAEERAQAGKCLKAIEKLALDGKHPSQGYWWLRQAIELHEQFFKPAESNQCSAAYLAWFDRAAACEPKIGERDIRDLAQWTCERCLVPADRAKIPAKWPQYCHSGTILGYGGLNAQCDRDRNANAIVQFLAKYPNRHDVAWDALRTMAKYGAKAQVFAEIEYRVINSWDDRLDCWHVFNAICETKGASDQEKADFMTKLYQKTGAHQFFYFLMDDKRPRTHVAMTNKTCQAFFASLKKGTKSNERIVEIRREIVRVNRGEQNVCPEAGHKLYAEACKVFPGTWPDAKRWDNGIMEQITGKYLDLCQHNMTSAPICCQAVMDKLTPKDKGAWYGVFGWNNVVWNSRDAKDGFYFKAMVRRAQNTDDPNYLGGLGFPKDTEKLPEGITADKFRARELGDMLRTNWSWNDGNRRNFKPALVAQMAGLWFRKFDVRTAVDDWNWMEDFMRTLTSAAWADQKGFAAAVPFDKVAGELFADPTSRDQYARWFLQLCRAAGVGEKYANQYLAALAKLEPAVRLNLLVRVMEMEDVITYGDSNTKTPDVWGPAFKNHLMPALKAVPTKHAPLAFLGAYGHLVRRVAAVCDWENKESAKMTDKAAAKARKDASDANMTTFVNENIRLKNLGASGWWEDNRRGAALYYCRKYEMGLATTNSAVLASVAQNTGATMNPWTIGWDWMRSILDRTYKEKQWESLYLLVSSLGDFDKDLTSYAARLRGEASTHLPGVYPVTERDPLYPLYVAADEFNRNNFERATSLLMKNLPTFERFAIRLPPDFTAWAVEQLRLERGNKDAMLIKARALATQLLENESKITPELAAAMMLVRAECYRDQQNFEAAKLEYQTIRNSPVYSKTPSGRKAMFRAIDLMIETGNASGAESTIEYWLSQPDREVQAEAHYFLAKIAFERKDYEEARKQLKEVFAIDFTHTEGRFLEGKWKLATGNEVDDTEVLIGKLADRTVIRPGQQLSVTVQDRNLSIAGGGASIPLVITTQPGGDWERVYLYPSVRDPSNFKGVIDVKLGKAVCSNLVLEVTGGDSASYTIDPEFLKARGLPLNEPKVLRVVDDGRLAIGAGMPRTDEEETKKKLAKIVEQGGVQDGFAGSLRPGNPLYIAVLDKDRSVGAGSEVTVDVRTTSGDKIENVILKETKPFTGVFRGEIPTSLPPPRAFASDTAVGYNAGDAISSSHPGEWKSLSDGQPGKWFAVDTMGSFLFSNVTFRLNAPEEIKKIRLSGTLGKDAMTLGVFPSGNTRHRAGLKRQQEWNVGTSSAAGVKTFFEKPNAPQATAVTNIAVTMKWNNGNVLVSYFAGAFKMEGGHDSLRLKVVPATTHGDTFKSLWLTVRVDGSEIITGTGPSLVNALGAVELEPGCHRIEVFSSTKTGDDSWILEWEPFGEDARLVPADWFDAEKHPEIYEFLADKAKISRTKDGFEATFAKPVRLRTVKVEFLDRIGPDVQLSAFAANGWDGKAILPVASDFSDAQKNQNLEVAPGDSISVRYTDEKTTKGDSRILTKSIGSSFTDASVGFYFEEIVQSSNGGEPQSVLHTAYRFMPGDTLLVAVRDSDLDLTEEADTANVTVTTLDGTKRELKLVEQPNRNHGPDDTEGVHSGYFLGLLKTCPSSVTNAPSSVLRCSGDEVLVVTYQDRENTNPGVPFLRSSRVNATQPFDPIITLFHTRKHLVVDNSADAKARLAQIRRRAGNEKVTTLYTEVVNAIPMSRRICASTNDIVANVAAPLPIRVNDPSRARHDASYLTVEAVSESEMERAEQDGDDPVKVRLKLALMGGFGGVNLLKGGEASSEARLNGSFNGVLNFAVGGVDPNVEATWTDPNNRPAIVSVNGSDRVFLRVLDNEGKELLSRTVKLVSNGSIALQDSTWSAERTATHVGERFYVKVADPDRDATDEADRVEIDVRTTGGVGRKVVLSETLPHSGVFTGTVRPVIFPPAEQIPAVATGGVSDVEQLLADDRLAVKYGDGVIFGYFDEQVLPGTKPSTLCVTGLVHKGANGDVRLFSKRFRDPDTAVLVQFRLAECLFEQAKDHRKLKHGDKSAEAIAKGRAILEEALKNNPESSHVAEGEFLLANLYQELGSEAKQAKDAAKKEGDKAKQAEADAKMKQCFNEALARFSSILAVWPEGEFAPRAQYHKAYCLEMLGDYKLAGEEYVKMTYLYPESELVGDATIRLATYYYRMEKRYEVAAKIYENFAKRFPQHDKAARSLFMCGSCYVKQAEKLYKEACKRAKEYAEKHHTEYRDPQSAPGCAENYTRAVKAFDDMAEKYRAVTTPELRAQALYWAGDASLRKDDARKAYIYLKRTILEYPETEWARRARGLMLQNGKAFKDLD